MLTRLALLSGLSLFPLAAGADAVSDALQAASDAYAAGDLATTSAQLNTATKELVAQQSNLLLAQFPAAPDGWTRADNADMVAGMQIMGGGAAAEVNYTAPDGVGITVTAYADNPMVSGFAGMLADPAMMAMMGKVVDINGTSFVEQEGATTMALLESRVLLQANGDAAKAQEILALFDLAALARFDAQ